MVRDRAAYQRLCEDENRRRLQRLSVEETIAIGEALLTSELMDLSDFPDDDHPLSLAISLGIQRP